MYHELERGISVMLRMPSVSLLQAASASALASIVLAPESRRCLIVSATHST